MIDTLSLELYKKLYLIRSAEQAIIQEYDKNEMKTPCHMSRGQEHAAVGIISALMPDDQIVTSYRSHAAYLAKTGDAEGFFAEMYGKATGVQRGRAGSMHISKHENGHVLSSAIVASGIPVACGLAYANKLKKNGRVVAVFFGDGAVDEGNFWESLNIACAMQLPILFVYEDNGLAVHAPKEARHGYRSLEDIVRQFECEIYSAYDNDVETVAREAQFASEYIRSLCQPAFLFVECYRYLEHVGVKEDFGAGYRGRDTWWYDHDCLKIQRERIPEKESNIIEQEIDMMVALALEKAKADPFPEAEELYATVL